MADNEALRLADALENLEATGWGGDCFALTKHSEQQAELAAAKLRRQHAEIENLRDSLRWMAKRFETERDALLAALEIAARQNEHDMLMTGEELRQCRAVIAQIKGGSNG